VDFLKTYKITVKTLAPVFIGSGTSIPKKEYVFDRRTRKVYIPDQAKMLSGFQKLKLLDKYYNYLLYEDKDLGLFFKENLIQEKQYLPWMSYSLDSGDAVIEGRSRKEVLVCIKDAYGNPYIPGSSLKGALRTALLGHALLNRNVSDPVKNAIKEEIKNKEKKDVLKYPMESIEQDVFHTLNRYPKKKKHAANDHLAGIRISDSKPLALANLVLCQKVDVTVDGKEKPINVFRECIRPDVTVEFDMTIDTKLYPYDVEYLTNAVNRFFSHYQKTFLEAFGRQKVYPKNAFYLGGGCGYASKTVTYAIFGKEEGVRVTSEIFNRTLPKFIRMQHQHHKDIQLGVSPRLLKCTRYNGEIMEMGLCQLQIQ
jgi:CRISPR-associated protein Csm5